MIYHLTNFTCKNIKPEEDLIEALSFLYGLLAPGGSIFVAYADLLDSASGTAVCGLAEKYFRHSYPNGNSSDTPFSL